MQILFTVFYVVLFTLQLITAVYLLIPFVFTSIHVIKKMIGAGDSGKRKPCVTSRDFEFAIVVTAHEETQFIHPLVDSILKQSYGNFYVYIVADSCDISSLNFSDQRVTVLKPESALNSKIRSINYGINNFKKQHDALIILDADNLIHPNFLGVMNDHFQKGYKAVQADFKAKNTDTPFARMDAIGDMFNFFLEREMRMELGLSAAIWGSGIAIDLELYKEVIYHNFLGGFDKRLQAHLVQRVPLIAFAKDAILYDEKIASGASLEKQRTRWLNAQFKYFKLGWTVFAKGIRNKSFNQAYFAFITLRPPLFMLFGLVIMFGAINYFIDFRLTLSWVVIILLFLLSFITIIAIKSNDRRLIRTVFIMPLFAIRQTLALLKMKQANKSFLKTKHYKVVYIDDIMHKRSV